MQLKKSMALYSTQPLLTKHFPARPLGTKKVAHSVCQKCTFVSETLTEIQTRRDRSYKVTHCDSLKSSWMCCEPDWVTALKLPDPCPHMTAHCHTPHRQSAGRQEIIHTVSQREASVLCQPERFTACLLSPAIEVIHRTIMLQVIVQKNTAACCTSTSTSFPCHSWIIPPESQPHTHCTGGEGM